MKQPFDVEGHLALVPANATIKGMFWNDLYKVALGVGVRLPPGRYAAFNDYPLVDYMREVANLARAIDPSESILEGMRHVGGRAFVTLTQSLTGRVLFAMAGRDLPAALGLVSEAYKRCLSPGSASLVDLAPGRAVIELRDIWTYPIAYQVGVFEKAIDHYGHIGTVQLRSLSPCDADFLLQWR
jgi:uncharacterized protein (TIGR02265 family)